MQQIGNIRLYSGFESLTEIIDFLRNGLDQKTGERKTSVYYVGEDGRRKFLRVACYRAIDVSYGKPNCTYHTFEGACAFEWVDNPDAYDGEVYPHLNDGYFDGNIPIDENFAKDYDLSQFVGQEIELDEAE